MAEKTAQSEGRLALLDACRKAMRIWAPPPQMTVSQWADSERRLSAETGAEPGRYRTSRTEYARGIMDAVSDKNVHTVVAMTSSQLGKTTILENIIGYYMHYDKCPMMLVMPTQHLCEEFSKDRITPMLRDTPALRGLVVESNAKKSGNTLLSKHFPGGLLVMGWPTSPATLAGRPIRVALGDECDRWGTSGKEGSPVSLFTVRTTAFRWNAKHAFFSTPTIQKQSRIEKLYQSSDQRKFYIPCPSCSDRFVLEFEHLRWVENPVQLQEDGGQLRTPKEAWFECPSCNARIDDTQRHRAVRQGEWRAHAEFNGTAGFWLWAGYSPFLRAFDIAKDWLAAQDDPEHLVTVTNTLLGRSVAVSGEAPAWERVATHREPYTPGEVPVDACLLTTGVDVQQDRLELSTWAWGKGRRCWLVDHTVIPGSPDGTEVWARLTDFVSRPFKHAGGATIFVSRVAIDSGYATTRVYAWARQMGNSKVMVTKGYNNLGGGMIVGQPAATEVTTKGKRISRGVKVWPIDVFKLKDELYGRLRLESPEEGGGPKPAGWIALYEVSEEFCRQLVAEALVSHPVKVGHGVARQEWIKLRPRNEALDCWVMARAAAHNCGIDQFSDRKWASLFVALGLPEVAQVAPVAQVVGVQMPQFHPAPALPAPPPPPPPPTPARVAPKQNSWLSGRSGGGWSKGWR